MKSLPPVCNRLLRQPRLKQPTTRLTRKIEPTRQKSVLFGHNKPSYRKITSHASSEPARDNDNPLRNAVYNRVPQAITYAPSQTTPRIPPRCSLERLP